MNSDELYTLKSMVLDNYEQYHDGLRILLESDKGLYKAFGQSPRTKYLKTENFYLTSKERLTYMMGFIDALAWLTRQGKLVPDTFPTDIAGFTDPEETPEERAEYFEKRYKGLSPEQRAELEAFDAGQHLSGRRMAKRKYLCPRCKFHFFANLFYYDYFLDCYGQYSLLSKYFVRNL